MTGHELVAALADGARGQTVVDRRGSRIVVGSRIAGEWVRVGARDTYWPAGIVTEVSDCDGDADDYGNIIAINPKVTVKFDNGTEDTFSTTYTSGYYVEPAIFEAEELMRKT